MSKLNWQKLNYQSKQQAFREKSETPAPFNYDDNSLWSLPGKHYGTHLTKLPLNYLLWILDNSTSGKYKGIAESELYRRYNELPNT
jgi:hypothetical protein